MSEEKKNSAGNLNDVRRRIDEVDRDILKNLQERLEISLQTRRLKSQVRDQDREKRLLDRLKADCGTRQLLEPEFVLNIFERIITQSLSLQETTGGLIGFQGEHGAYGEEAARLFDPSLVPIPCRQFDDVFQSVADGRLDCGLVPVQNSLGGPITRVNDLLLETSLKVTGEVILPVRHCLLANPETNHREIREVFSHPQALSQCRDFIARQGLIPRPYYDTAGAARKLALDRSRTEAVVAGRLCAELYHLEIIKEDIQDRNPNLTRFLILSRDESKREADKCSMIFSVPDSPGALFKTLQIFAVRNINLTRIESFRDRDHPGRHLFFCDFQIGARKTDLPGVLAEIEEATLMMKYLGCYKEHR